MGHSKELADRIRDALADRSAVREMKMFGGLSFLVNEKMVVSVRSDGNLLVRADPARADELLTHTGARSAEMGAGRQMSKSWISVEQEALVSQADLEFWIGVALEYNNSAANTTSSRGRKPHRSR